MAGDLEVPEQLGPNAQELTPLHPKTQIHVRIRANRFATYWFDRGSFPKRLLEIQAEMNFLTVPSLKGTTSGGKAPLAGQTKPQSVNIYRRYYTLPKMWEEDYILDRGRVGQDHDQPVYPDPKAPCRWHAIL